MKKLIILSGLFAVSTQGMPEEQKNYEHIRMCSAPGGLWSLEEEYYARRRAFSTPDDLKPYINQKSKKPCSKKNATNSHSKKQKSSNFKKKIVKKSSETQKKVSKPKSKSNKPINSIRENVIDARNQKQKTDKNVKKVLKKKTFEKRFTNFLGNNIGKFVADKLFDFFQL